MLDLKLLVKTLELKTNLKFSTAKEQTLQKCHPLKTADLFLIKTSKHESTCTSPSNQFYANKGQTSTHAAHHTHKIPKKWLAAAYALFCSTKCHFQICTRAIKVILGSTKAKKLEKPLGFREAFADLLLRTTKAFDHFQVINPLHVAYIKEIKSNSLIKLAQNFRYWFDNANNFQYSSLITCNNNPLCTY